MQRPTSAWQLIAVATALLACAHVLAQAPQNTLRTYRLTINSPAASGTVRVRGALWVDGSTRQVRIIEQDTPFELTAFGNIVNGIFETTAGAQIRVELVDVASSQRRLVATSQSVILGQGLAPNADWGFVRGN